MKFIVFSLCLCLVLTQSTPIDKLRQQAARASKMADSSSDDASSSLSFLEKQQELAFEMEKDTSTHKTAEADAVENLAQSELQDAQQQAQQQQQTTQTTQTDAVQQQAQQQQTAASAATTTTTTPTKNEKDSAKPMEWEDAVLVEDLTVERASADANTRYIGANMKTSKVGQPKGASFLQMAPPAYYYPIHPAFLQQSAQMRAQQQTTQGRSEEGAEAKTQGWGDYGTPLYYAQQFGSFDGLGAAGANMYGNYGYAPYTSGYNPAYTQAAGGQSAVGYPPMGGNYYSPYAAYAPYAPPPPPPMPTDLPLPPWIQI